jgi:hypothetical protein
MTGVQILLALRNRTAIDWPSLCRHFGVDPREYHTGNYVLREKLDELRRALLIEFEDDGVGNPSSVKGSIDVLPYVGILQNTLGISLKTLAELEPDTSMVVKPYFGAPPRGERKHDVFVLMPFIDDLRPIYTDHITKVAKSLALTVARADDFFSAHSIMSDIWNAICDARIVLADCTGRNANVFYEIGIAHTLGKTVVLLTQKPEDVPFDLRHLRFIEYKYTPPGMRDFEARLGETIKAELPLTGAF